MLMVLTTVSIFTAVYSSSLSSPFCDDSNCLEQFSSEQIGSDIDGAQLGDAFGQKVAVDGSGTVIAIGAPKYDGSACSECGRVDSFEWDSHLQDWIQRGQSFVGTTDNERLSCVDLTMDGNMLAVGSHNFNQSAGIVSFYEWNGTGWFDSRPSISGENPGDQSFNGRNYFKLNGAGNIVAVGAQMYDHNGLTNAGYVRVFEWSVAASSWLQLGTPIFGEKVNERIGAHVTLSKEGWILALGSHYADPSGSGMVKVFHFNHDKNDWVQLGQTLKGRRRNDRFGVYNSLNDDGNILAVGSPGFDGLARTKSEAGGAHMYKYDPSQLLWVQLGKSLEGEHSNDRFGYRVSLNSQGNILAVGASANDGTGRNAGHVRLFQLVEGNSWVRLGKDLGGRAKNAKTGRQSLAISQDASTLIIGGISTDKPSVGHIRVYKNMFVYNEVSTSGVWLPIPAPFPTARPTPRRNNPSEQHTSSSTSFVEPLCISVGILILVICCILANKP